MNLILKFISALIDLIFWGSLTCFVVAVFYIMRQVPSLDGVTEGITFSIYKNGAIVGERTLRPKDKTFIKSESLPTYVTGAILVSEDSTFYQHRGIDWFEVQRAFERNVKEKRYARGASTITQQVVKNAFLTRDKTLFRKVIEAITALRLELKLSKVQILDYYINLIELGEGIYGIREGAKAYFNVAPKDLTPEQAATLSFLIPSPVKYGADYKKKTPSKYRDARVKSIMANMVRQKYMSPELFKGDLNVEEEIILEDPDVLEVPPEFPSQESPDENENEDEVKLNSIQL